MADLTQIVTLIQTGDPSAAEQLLPLIYNDLRWLALAGERPGGPFCLPISTPKWVT